MNLPRRAEDHDADPSTPLRCAGFDREVVGPYDTFAYDATYALAYALQDMIEVQNKTEILGRDLYDTLIRRVRFEGVTGTVDFYDASATSSDSLYDGDRRAGVSFALMNYVDNQQGFVRVGRWFAGAGGFAQRWHSVPGVGITFSTADNRPPLQSVPPRVTAVRIGILLPVFSAPTTLLNPGTDQLRSVNASQGTPITWSPRVGVYQALRELNNKSDGISDWLLPRTHIEFAFRDSKCDARYGLTGALSLTETSSTTPLVGIIGAGCSDATETAAQVASVTGLPIISPSATSPALSNGISYPSFLRTIPSETIVIGVMMDALITIFNYSRVALVSSNDACESWPVALLARAFAHLNTVLGAVLRVRLTSLRAALPPRRRRCKLVRFPGSSSRCTCGHHRVRHDQPK